MLVPGSRRLCRVGLAAVLVTALCALAFLDLPPEFPEPRPEPPPTLGGGDGGEPPGTRSVVAYSWARRLALDYRPSAECPGDDEKISDKDFSAILNPSKNWLGTLDGRLFLFSAHLDERVPGYPAVRVIGVRPQPLDNTQVYCTIWHDDAGWLRSLSMEALIADIWLEHWGGGMSESYTGVLITCPLPIKSSEFRPLRAAVTASPCNGDYPSHSIEVNSRLLKKNLPKVKRKGKSSREKFTLCIKGLDFDEDISERLVAFVELNLILGADKFHFYVFNVHENVLKVLKLFESSNVVRWWNLTLPGDLSNVPSERRKLLEEDVWLKRRLELIPYNDCFYESIGESEYVVPIDIDESIVPKHSWDWQKLISEEKLRLGKSFDDFASYAARNAHFFTEIQQTYRTIKRRHPYLDTTRSAYISPEGDSVKSFISTKRTLTVHNHYALATLDSVTRRAHHFRPEDVLKHHHRFCDSKYLNCDILKRDVVQDNSAVRFSEKLYRRTRTVLANLTNR